MEISSLDITLRRMQGIEQQFQALNNIAQSKPEVPDLNFQEILNSNMASIGIDNALQTGDADKIFSNPIARNLPQGQIETLIDKYAQKNDLDKDFVKALIKQESGFKADAKSHCGAMGLMQLMPGTAKTLGVDNAFNPEENIAGGTKYLRQMLDKFNGNKELALAAYNAGPGAVQKYGGIPPYNETKNYVKNIITNYENYKNQNNRG